MRLLISWINPHDGSVSGGVEWPGYFEDTVPGVGDTIVESLPDDEISACEVVERYVYFTHDNHEVWHLVCKYVELMPGRREAFHLVKAIEGRNAFTIDMDTAAAHGLTVAGGTPFPEPEDDQR